LYIARLTIFLSDTVLSFIRKGCIQSAAAISFYALFSFFPLILAIISVGAFAKGSIDDQIRLANEIAQVVPISTFYITERVNEVVNARGPIGIVGLLALFWTASAAFGSIRNGINTAWGLKNSRPFIKERFRDFLLVIGAGLLMVFIFFLTPVSALLSELVNSISPGTDLLFGFLGGLITGLISTGVSFIFFTLLYLFLPNTKVAFGDVWLGALIGSLSFEGAKWGFVWYVNTFPIYNAVYGPIGAIMALLTWVNVSAIILLFGAHLASLYATNPIRAKEKTVLKSLWAGISCVRLRWVNESTR